jgi:hypothetical protein
MQREIVAKNISQTRERPLIKTLLRIEEVLRPYVHYPAGIRCLVTCRKPAN